MASLLLQIESALIDLYNPNVSTAQRAAVEVSLAAFRSQTPNAWQPALDFLQQLDPLNPAAATPPSLQMQFYASSIVSHFAVPKVFDHLDGSTQAQLIDCTLVVLQKTYERLHPAAASKLVAAYVRLIKNDTTVQHPAHIGSLLQSLSSPTNPPQANLLVEVHILAVLVDEFPSFSLNSPMRGARRRAVTAVLKTIILPSLPSLLCQLLSDSQRDKHSDKHTAPQHHVLSALATVLSYPTRYKVTRTMDVSPLISLPLLSTLFATASPSTSPPSTASPSSPPPPVFSPHATLALSCVNEIISRNCWPSGSSQDFVLLVCGHALSLVSAAGSDPAALGALPEEYRSQLTNFLLHFSSLHLRSALLSPTFSSSTFLLLTASYTFNLPTSQEQTAALAVWIKIAEFAEGDERATGFLAQNEQGLSGVLEAAIR